MAPSEKVWDALEAQENLPELIRRSLLGTPQLIRSKTGEEVVIVDRGTFDALRPTMKEVLLGGGMGPDADEDPIDAVVNKDE